MSRKERTIKRAVEMEGIALHSGDQVHVRIEPAPSGTGVIFQRTDMEDGPDIPALAGYLTVSQRRTVLRAGNGLVGMVEHLLSSCLGLGIDNVFVRVSSDELPGMDGSAKNYAELLAGAGVTEQKSERKVLTIKDPLVFREGDAELLVLPPSTDGLKIRYQPSYPEGVDATPLEFRLDRDSFLKEIAPARTFVQAEEIDSLLEAGLGKGANKENTVVLGGEEAGEMRMDREPTRHKILDILGDLALLGADLHADIVATRSGHSLNQTLVRHLREDLEALEVAGEGRGIQYEIQDVMRRLPHRYPFLLVDRVLEVEGYRRAVGIKNVTINEPFFQGHFPAKPLMPGVLQLEALAQLAGFLLQRKLDLTGKLGVLAAIDKVRFRGTVVPGDQLRLEVETLRVSASRVQVKGQGKVGRRVVSEALLSFAMIDA